MTPTQTHAAKDTALVIGLIIASIVFGTNGQGELAATALGGVLGFVVPSRRHAPLVAALVGGSIITLGG